MAVIKLLKECPDYAPILAFWSYREWYKNRDIDLDILIRAYKIRINDSSLPLSMVAVEDGIPAGMVSLKENDLWSRKDINPWLASLYVLPEYRKNGIGSMLVTCAVNMAERMKLGRLFLFISGNRSDELKSFYSKRGWKYYENAPGNDNDRVEIFHYTLK